MGEEKERARTESGPAVGVVRKERKTEAQRGRRGPSPLLAGAHFRLRVEVWRLAVRNYACDAFRVCPWPVWCSVMLCGASVFVQLTPVTEV